MDFTGVTFDGPINFARSQFGTARFTGATFKGPVTFERAEFLGEAWLDSVTFEGTASFRGATFHRRAVFEYLEKPGDLGPEARGWPEEVTFRRWADFRGIVCHGSARFGGAQFEGRARFNGAQFQSPAGVSFEGAAFAHSRTLGHVDVAGPLKLDKAVFEAPIRVRAAAKTILCDRTQFQRMTTIDIWRGDIFLKEASFAEPSIVSATSDANPMPKLLSLQRANVAQLTVSGLDLRECSFLDVHNLDGLRIEGGSELDVMKGRMPRRVICDETSFRKDPKRDPVQAERIARAYRSLRKGREDSKDAPGAADFYYGEMEMRRKGAQRFDSVVLPAYWLTSGYALEAWRAVVALILTVVVIAAGLALGGFDPKPGFDPELDFWDSLLYSAESTTSLFRAPSPPEGAELTYLGHVLQMVLRLLGPLFFGLALLALRGRVKR